MEQKNEPDRRRQRREHSKDDGGGSSPSRRPLASAPYGRHRPSAVFGGSAIFPAVLV